MSRKPVSRKTNKIERVRREKDPIPWRYCLTTLACGLFLVAGFFGAARQHFASIEYGIKNSKLRKQIEELESENRRLLLSREIALSPGEIKKSAKQIGMIELSASNIEIFSTREEKQSKGKTVQPLIEKTVNSKPVREVAVQKSSEAKDAKPAGKDARILKKPEDKIDRRAKNGK